MQQVRRMGILLLVLLLAACATEPVLPVEDAGEDVPDEPETAVATPTVTPGLPDLGPAPEITNDVWINADEPITLASQRGKVVLIEFWTFG